MRRIGQAFSNVYNYMRRHKLKFGYEPKYPSLEVVVRQDETGTVSNSFYKPLKTGTDKQTYLTKLPVGNPTPNENKTSAFKVKQLTPHYNETTKLIVDDSAPSPNVVTELTPIQLEGEDTTPIQLTRAEGQERPPPPGLLILGTTQYDDDEADPSGKYDDDLSGKCLIIEGKFKSPKKDTAPIINSHISDTASNSHKSLTDLLKSNHTPILIQTLTQSLGPSHTNLKRFRSHTSHTKVLY